MARQTIYMPDDTLRAIRAEARKSGETISEYAVTAIHDRLAGKQNELSLPAWRRISKQIAEMLK